MPLSKEAIASAAQRLDQAEKTRKQIRQLSIEYPDITIDDSYAIQKAWIEMKVARGRVVKGHKIGLTSKAMQSALDIDEPDSGVLLDDMFFDDGGLIPPDRFIATRIEAELAFIIKNRIAGPHCSMFDVLNATDFVVPALEILDTRVERVDPQTKATRKIFDTIADNASSSAYVLGTSPRKLSAFDVRLCGMVMERRGEPVSVGAGAACLGNPLNAVVWLARKMVEIGSPLRAGDLVLSGALGPMVTVAAGDIFQARIHGLGSVRAVFESDGSNSQGAR